MPHSTLKTTVANGGKESRVDLANSRQHELSSPIWCQGGPGRLPTTATSPICGDGNAGKILANDFETTTARRRDSLNGDI